MTEMCERGLDPNDQDSTRTITQDMNDFGQREFSKSHTYCISFNILSDTNTIERLPRLGKRVHAGDAGGLQRRTHQRGGSRAGARSTAVAAGAPGSDDAR